MEIRRLENPPKRFVRGETFLFLGRRYALKIIEEQKPPLKLEGDFLLSRYALPKAREVFETWYRKRAGAFISERSYQLAQKSGLRYQCVRITCARKRWGSCTAKGNLNFSWQLIQAPPPVIDYVIIHELAHLTVKNHSREFWGYVKFLLPDYKILRTWLKDNGHLLTWQSCSGVAPGPHATCSPPP